MLKRKIWSKLEDFKANANKKTLLLTGARQVGKTYIVEQFAKARYKSFVEINFVEDAAAKAIFHDVADEKDVLRRITAYAQGKVIPGETLVLFDEVQSVGNEFLGERNLFVGFFIHKVVKFAVAVEILHFLSFDVSKCELVGRVESTLDDAAGNYVADFGADKSCAFARFDVLKINDGENVTVLLESGAFSEITC